MHPVIEKAVFDSYRRIELVRLLIPEVELLEMVIDEFGNKFKSHYVEGECGMEISICKYFTSIYLKVHIIDMKDIIPLIRFIVQNGYKLFGKPWDYPEGKSREYHFIKNPANNSPYRGVRINVSCVLPSKGLKCEYVKVGEKTEDVFELRCGGKVYEENLESNNINGGKNV